VFLLSSVGGDGGELHRHSIFGGAVGEVKISLLNMPIRFLGKRERNYIYAKL
jgi:hypothetical protein